MEILTFLAADVIEKGSLFSEKCWVVGLICFISKLEEYANDHRRNAPITPAFYYELLRYKLRQILPKKTGVKLLIAEHSEKKI